MVPTLLLVTGAFVVWLNFYTSFLRGRLHRWLRPGEPARHVSGFPLVGTVLLGLAWWRAPSGSLTSWLAPCLLLIDTGGLHWFLLVMLWQTWKSRER